ncbi:S-layer homology domain-containing protein [Candidatus Peregrinibacteria bacterium]|nr:S-layer homology domain-containing protein [Candidatus Peregrinibacteria bacterium]
MKRFFIFAAVFLVIGAAAHFAGAQFAERGNDEAIKFVQKNGVKLPGKKFQPDKIISRAEFLAMLFPVFYYEKPAGANCFPDVKNQWFAKFVCEAKNMEIINARPDGTFQPNQPITFLEAAQIMVKAIGFSTNGPQQYASILIGKKAIPISITGFEQKLTRGESAQMLYRFSNISAGLIFESRTYDEVQKWEAPQTEVAPPTTEIPPPSPPFPAGTTPFTPPTILAGKYPYSKMSKNFKSYFENDPIAEAVLRGEETIDLFDYDPNGCYGHGVGNIDLRILPVAQPVADPYVAKILNGLRQLGYNMDHICGPTRFMKGVLRFQKEHGLPYSNIVDAKMLKVLADELKAMEQRDREAAKKFTCYEFMAPTPYEDVSKEHLAYLEKTAIDVFPQRLRIQKKDCINKQTFSSISEKKKLICSSGYFPQYASQCKLLKFKTNNMIGRSDYDEIRTIMHEYSHFIDTYMVDTTGFYNISYDVSDRINDVYRWRPHKPTFPEDGQDHTQDPAWDEMKQNFFSYAQGWESLANPGYATGGEDFAVSVTMYVLHGEVFRDYMKDKPPLKKKYNWLKKNVFDGKEFYTGDREYKKYAPDLYHIPNGIFAADGYITIRPLFTWKYVQPADVKQASALSFEEDTKIDEEIENALKELIKNPTTTADW